MPKLALYAVYALSGFLSLGYQVVWFRIFADRFGSTNLTFALVIASFIGGLGAGGACSRQVTELLARRSKTRDPVRLYGLIELGVAASAALTLLLPSWSADLAATWPYALEAGIHRPSALAHGVEILTAALCVFAPCFAMGMTFPLLCTAFASEARYPSALYAWNTLGACTGVLACELFLLGALGHEHLLIALLAGNAVLGAVCLRMGSSRLESTGRAPREAEANDATRAPSPRVLFACAIASGFLTGAFEADVLRRLQFLDCRTGAALSCISFWAILAIFLASTAVRFLPRLHLRHVQLAAVLACGCYLLAWQLAYPLREWATSADEARVRAALPPLAPGLSGSFQFFHFGYGFSALLWFTGLFVFPPFFLLSLVRRAESLELLDAALPGFSGDVALHRLRGDVLAALERWSEALLSFDRALELAPDDPPAVEGRARCLEKMRR